VSKTDEKWTWVSACKVFGVSPDASWDEEIKSAHARMMHEWHPDHGDTLERTEKTKTLNLAWPRCGLRRGRTTFGVYMDEQTRIKEFIRIAETVNKDL